MLGSEQHGHMENVGYDMYCKILSESINEAKGIKSGVINDVTVDLSVNAYIPESYIESANQRIDMYKKIASIDSEEDEFEIYDELADRYGDMPKPLLNIIAIASLKPVARSIGCIEITEKMRKLTLKFSDNALTPEIVFGLDARYKGRVKVLSDETPSITIVLTERDNNIIEFVKKLLIFIKELQNDKK